MKCYDVKVHVHHGHKRHKFLSHIHAESMESARQAIQEYWNAQYGVHIDAMEITERCRAMPQLVVSRFNVDMVAKAEEIINNFLNNRNHTLYAVNPDGSTFTLDPGCILLPVESFQIDYGLEVQVK